MALATPLLPASAIAHGLKKASVRLLPANAAAHLPRLSVDGCCHCRHRRLFSPLYAVSSTRTHIVRARASHFARRRSYRRIVSAKDISNQHKDI
jgi:hypothetical protein